MKNPNKKFDLSFGNSVAVRQAFLDVAPYNGFQFTYNSMMEMDYPVHNGDPELVEITKQIIKRQVGNEYKHVFITNGATGADVIALRAYAQQGISVCRTRKAPYYTRFPGMIEAAGMHHWSKDISYTTLDEKVVFLLDIPHNPTGSLDTGMKFHSGPIILDAVYYNNVYCNGGLRGSIEHNVLTGSYSKLLGINGIRLGWLATNDDLLADRISKLITSEYCGLSVPSASIIKSYLRDFDWDNFERRANMYLDFNRNEVSKLEKYFGNISVPRLGMFYYAPMDQACQKLMEKAGIIWTKGSVMGTSDDFGRLNVGQDVGLIANAVSAVLKIDKI
jgi:aspartate/methionine/tyrosine aminotransferase